MLFDPEVHHIADLLIARHGADARRQADLRLALLKARRDATGHALWSTVAALVREASPAPDETVRPPPPTGEFLN